MSISRGQILNIFLKETFEGYEIEVYSQANWQTRGRTYTFTINGKSSQKFFNSYKELEEFVCIDRKNPIWANKNLIERELLRKG